jgi:hypothetical protein
MERFRDATTNDMSATIHWSVLPTVQGGALLPPESETVHGAAPHIDSGMVEEQQGLARQTLPPIGKTAQYTALYFMTQSSTETHGHFRWREPCSNSPIATF